MPCHLTRWADGMLKLMNDMPDKMHPDEIRTLFSGAMSAMYCEEVPLYGELVELVRDVNAATLKANPALRRQLEASGELDRLEVERHGAIRLGTAEELYNIRRMFAVMGMYPVGYYDLSVAGLPVHSTAFRPLDSVSLQRNPFRIFTSLIRLELLADQALARQAEAILAQRNIMTERALELIAMAEDYGGLSKAEATEFVNEALETFRWHSRAKLSLVIYEELLQAHGLIADVVSFKGPHINHLTPRTLDIDAVQAAMPERNIPSKAVIEGPPRREVGILLRQTSFKALQEAVNFDDEPGTHTARFGEVEQRGMALKPAGRALYDACLDKARSRVRVEAHGEQADDYVAALTEAFAGFPDDPEALRTEGLAYFNYRATGSNVEPVADIETLLARGYLIADPQTYEDFLPVSAAGIFQSNLGADEPSGYAQGANREAFEAALGVKVQDELALYAAIEMESLQTALVALGQEHLLEAVNSYVGC